MQSTQIALLAKLQQSHDADVDCWRRFVVIYSPLLEEWATRLRVPAQERQDLIQETLIKLLSGIGSFHRRESGSFRGWLHTILRNCWFDRVRKHQPMELIDSAVADSSSPNPQQIVDEEEYRQYVMRRVFSLIIAEFPEKTQTAFRKYVIEGQAASDVARDLGINTNTLYLIRNRVLNRLRSELAGLLDDE